MLHVVAYDIEDDRARARVAGVLEAYGWRVQESVFECRLSAGELEALAERLGRELGGRAAGQVRIYRVCDGCLKASLGVGQVKAVDIPSCYIV